MPRRPRRSAPCTTPGCPEILTTGTGKCPRCRPAKRRYSSEHQAIARKLATIYPSGPCARCHQPGSWSDPRDPLTAGHIDHEGPTVLTNYQPEHRSCGTRERNERRGRDEDGRFL